MFLIDLNSFETITGLPIAAGFVIVFLLGSCIGSFLNVVIYRIPNGQSIVFPNSACPACKTPIKAYDNIPIFGWLMLGGKCRSCKEPIAWRYPAVELLTALLYLLIFWQIGFTPYLPVVLVFASIMIALIFIDADHMILPNVITYPMFFLALLVRIVLPLAFTKNYFDDVSSWPLAFYSSYPTWLVSFAGAMLGALIGGGSLWLIGEIWKRLRGVDAMGLGDVKLLLGIGALLGWRLTLLTIFLGALTGAVGGIFLMAKDREKGMQSQIPFGIFLGIGFIASMIFGTKLLNWYLGQFI